MKAASSINFVCELSLPTSILNMLLVLLISNLGLSVILITYPFVSLLPLPNGTLTTLPILTVSNNSSVWKRTKNYKQSWSLPMYSKSRLRPSLTLTAL